MLFGILFIDEAIQPVMSLIAEEDFLIKIRIILKLLLSPIREHTTLLVVKRRQFLRQFDFVRSKPRSYRKIRHNDITYMVNA